MPKLSQLDKAIAALEAEKAIIDYAITKLQEQKREVVKPARTRKKVSPDLRQQEAITVSRRYPQERQHELG